MKLQLLIVRANIFLMCMCVWYLNVPIAHSAECSPVCTSGQICNTDTGQCLSTTNQQCGAGRSDCTAGFTCAPNGFCFPSNQTSAQPSANSSQVLQNSGSGTGGGLVNALQFDSIEALIAGILSGISQLGAIFLVLALIWVGVLFVFAQGKEEEIKKARDALYWCAIGGLLLLGAQAISLAIKGFIGAL